MFSFCDRNYYCAAIWSLHSKIINNVTLSLCYVIDRPEYAEMCQIVDPYTYLDRYARSQTILLQNAGNDEFFLCSGLNIIIKCHSTPGTSSLIKFSYFFL